MARWQDVAEQGWAPRRRVPVESTAPEEARDRQLDATARAAFDHLRAYGNCARATLWAVATHLGIPAPDAVRAMLGLCGGIAGTGGTCGGVIGGLAALGLGLGSADLMDAAGQQLVRTASAEFVAEFRKTFGSALCFEVQEGLVGFRNDNPSKEPAWKAAGGCVACALVCGEAARSAARIVLDRRACASPPQATPGPAPAP
ncbi:MAG: C-GCAxxG-C-C family (seleno)protein [Candidatus Bipolaricaulota bacterium]